MDEDGSERAGAKVAGHAFMAVQDAFVVRDKGEEGGEGIMLGGDEGEDFGELADEVVDLEVVVGVCLVLLGRRCGLFRWLGGRAALSFGGVGGVICCV